jgi:hypothetical protein
MELTLFLLLARRWRLAVTLQPPASAPKRAMGSCKECALTDEIDRIFGHGLQNLNGPSCNPVPGQATCSGRGGCNSRSKAVQSVALDQDF